MCCSYEEHSIEQGKRQGYEQKNLANMGPEMIKKPPLPKMEKSGLFSGIKIQEGDMNLRAS
jgi:hypothetical protein